MSVICKECGTEIPKEVLWHRGHSTAKERFCNRECRRLYEISQDHFQEMSRIGKFARSQAVAMSNQKNPRRRK